MLRKIKIQNIGIIDNLEIHPQPGLNVITGETGAGKSLILAALDAVLGSRMTVGMVRNGAMRGNIEAEFITQRQQSEQQTETVRLQREISGTGRSRMYIDGDLSTTTKAREFSLKLIEVHGQHEHQRILDADSHLDLLDQFSKSEQLTQKVSALYSEYRTLRNQIRQANLDNDERKQRLDFLHFAVDEIEKINPQTNEYETLQQELAIIKNSGKLFQDMRDCYGMIRNDEASILERLQLSVDVLSRHKQILPDLTETIESLREAYFILETTADYLREKKDSLDFSPERLQTIEDRIHEYQVLFKKYGATTKDVIERRDYYLNNIHSLETSDQQLEQAQEKMKTVEIELIDQAKELSRIRRGSVLDLEKKIAEELKQLGMEEAQVRVMITRALTSSEDQTNCSAESIYEKGLDRVEFFLAANQGEPLQPLRKVISGGELSRISLALKNIISAKKQQAEPSSCFIFDEIDVGVGGEVAHRIAKRLKQLAMQHQVIVITHLHQIASVADYHFSVSKETIDGRTFTRCHVLDEEQRVKEISRILGDSRSQSAVRSHAKELLGIS